MSDLNELEKLVPEDVFVLVNGEKLSIKPFKFKPLLKVLKIVLKVADSGDLIGVDQYTIFRLLANNPDELMEVFVIATGKDIKFFDDINTDEGANLIAKIFKVNQDFFSKKVAPILEEMGLSNQNQLDLPNVQELNQNLEQIPQEITIED